MKVQCGIISIINKNIVGLANLHVNHYIIEEKCLRFSIKSKFKGRDLHLQDCTKKKKKKGIGQKFMNISGVNKKKNKIL